MSDLGTATQGSEGLPFQGLQGTAKPPNKGLAIQAFTNGSRHYGTPQASTLKQDENPAQPTPKRQKPNLASPQVPGPYRNINLLPFRPKWTLPMALGPTNPWLTNIAKEP